MTEPASDSKQERQLLLYDGTDAQWPGARVRMRAKLRKEGLVDLIEDPNLPATAAQEQNIFDELFGLLEPKSDGESLALNVPYGRGRQL